MTGAAIDFALRVSLLLAATWLGAAILAGAGGSAAMRHRAWLLGIAALFLLPLLAWALPALPIAVLAPAPASTFAGGAQTGSPGWAGPVGLAYLAGAGLLVARLAAARFALAGIWRSAAPSADPAWAALLTRLSAGLGLRRPVALRFARGPAMPMTWGTRAPRLLLPAEARDWDEERRRLVLLHELAHVARRDAFALSAASLACALYWFHPGIWLAARRLRAEQELAADDLVLAAGARPRAYAASLLELAERLAQPRPALAAAIARRSELERRMRAIVGSGSRRTPGSLFAGLSGALALAATGIVATVVPVAIQAPLQGAAFGQPATSAAAAHEPVPPAPPTDGRRAAPPPARRDLVASGMVAPQPAGDPGPALAAVPAVPPVPPVRAVPPVPTLPSVPAVPSVPTVPSLPAIAALPALPSTPAAPPVPSAHSPP